MDVVFTRMAGRRYGVTVLPPDGEPRGARPAPGFHEHIPHDLVHYVVEAELGLASGLYGRTAQGGGTFRTLDRDGLDARAVGRETRRRQKREERLRRDDHAGTNDMAVSEKMAGFCDVLWRRRHGERPDAPEPVRAREVAAVSPEVLAAAGRVVDRLDEIAPRWHALGEGGTLRFTWPSPVPHRDARG
ncbi:hypothetical protein [Actinomadura parmotrematis]|uniref:Uncharacterized protein n=1 Tax=Actinomadura parmotrematis TaxID=2864039 RepID=A0ABS7G5E5_9ACTN|nr:hypothetical protein [Actinomadura parmotrematis]MBW8487691.1 hypothetical protein [Actinomadura parmotrematis]